MKSRMCYEVNLRPVVFMPNDLLRHSLIYHSVSVYYVPVRTNVLLRHGSDLARPVIIPYIIHGLIYVSSTTCCGFFWGLAGWKLRLRPLRFFYVQLKVNQTSHLIYVVL